MFAYFPLARVYKTNQCPIPNIKDIFLSTIWISTPSGEASKASLCDVIELSEEGD